MGTGFGSYGSSGSKLAPASIPRSAADNPPWTRSAFDAGVVARSNLVGQLSNATAARPLASELANEPGAAPSMRATQTTASTKRKARPPGSRSKVAPRATTGSIAIADAPSVARALSDAHAPASRPRAQIGTPNRTIRLSFREPTAWSPSKAQIGTRYQCNFS